MLAVLSLRMVLDTVHHLQCRCGPPSSLLARRRAGLSRNRQRFCGYMTSTHRPSHELMIVLQPMLQLCSSLFFSSGIMCNDSAAGGAPVARCLKAALAVADIGGELCSPDTLSETVPGIWIDEKQWQ